MKKKFKLSLDSNVKWKDISPGGVITEAGNANDFRTGDWRSIKPVWIEENASNACCVPRSAPIRQFR